MKANWLVAVCDCYSICATFDDLGCSAGCLSFRSLLNDHLARYGHREDHHGRVDHHCSSHTREKALDRWEGRRSIGPLVEACLRNLHIARDGC